MSIEKILNCRVCRGNHLDTVFVLEDQYIATVFIKSLSERDLHKKYPLELVLCQDCGFVQLRHTLNRDMLFSHYWYRSGINQTMKSALQDVVSSATQYTTLLPGDVVCDIGCNDGTLLSCYPKKIHTIGIDPSKNMAAFSRQHADVVIVDYFSSDVFFSKETKHAKIVTSIAMFYSVEDSVAFSKGVAEILDEDGVWILQMSSLSLMLQNNCYDNIVHEHVGYYSMGVISTILKPLGLQIVDCSTNDINAGSLRLYIKKHGVPSAAVLALAQAEQEEGYLERGVYDAFAKRLERETQKFKTFLLDCDPTKTAFYGASTKGNVILQHVGATQKHAFGIAERNPLKYGYHTLGSDLKIISEDEMRQRVPKNIIVLPYHFKSEILQRESALIETGSSLVFPLPEFTVIGR
jgi:2-polyprenyl-3-methyl-5-hydroxy-6-metoxy-1,4-benzoquinol methylase